ncbi:YiiD C-terminal domain-containing protein [Aliikangiella coralliicola]|uniref:Thioesterase putative domain-containing protein n=1 Tax=Aliikangiella coralliicola TaxID=2592383 RepID=A0A545UH49_9GAMM|nr:YiiD C-terminal domain-containing protein [Aliikangiella coralliicola]TQV88797.1 hypothetical protein FLL46_04495 [Aliikangiella coralliicola]
MLKKYQKMVNESIPMTRYMEWSIQTLSSTHISTISQLSPNINVHGTGFAGSIYAAAMATGWTLLKCWYDHHQFDAELVAAEATIKYKCPVTSDFECKAILDQRTPQYEKLTERLSNLRSCGFSQEVEIICDAKVCAILTIQFVFKC